MGKETIISQNNFVLEKYKQVHRIEAKLSVAEKYRQVKKKNKKKKTQDQDHPTKTT